MLSSKKYTFWGLNSNRNAFGAQKRNLLVMNFFNKLCDLFIDQKFYAELKKVYFMGSEMRAQKRGVNLSRVKKILLLSVVFIWNWKSFFQLFSKLILKYVIHFMNRKSLHFFISIFEKKLIFLLRTLVLICSIIYQ
jgi:hypothetical protein